MSKTEPEEVSRLLNLNHAARLLTVSRRTLERLIADGKFPHPVKINRSSRVLRSDVERYIDNCIKGRAHA